MEGDVCNDTFCSILDFNVLQLLFCDYMRMSLWSCICCGVKSEGKEDGCLARSNISNIKLAIDQVEQEVQIEFDDLEIEGLFARELVLEQVLHP